MAINIQEILHPSDSDVIKFEKINYNFDQIVANGGGPTGPKGPAGAQGTPGFTGAKGEQGVKGEQGLTGATTSPWKVIPIDSDAGQPLGDGVNDYVILKPKQNTDNLRPIIFLGDETFDDENNLDGNITLRSTLTIGRHAVGVNNASDEYLTFWHGTNTLTNEQVAITLSSSEETDSVNNWTRFSLDKTYNSSNTSEVELRINLDKIKLEGHVTIGTAGSLLLNNTDLGAVMPSAGMIRYNSNSKTFQGGVLQSDNTTVQWIDFCMAPCGQGGSGTIAIDPPGDLNLYSNGSEGEIGINPPGDLELNDTGAPWGGNTTIATTNATAATTTPTNATSATTTPTNATSATTTPTNATSATTQPTNATAASYTITYDANQGSGAVVPTSGALPLIVSGANALSRGGYSFVDWNTTGSGTGTGYDPGDTYNTASNVTLYAQWQQTSFTVSYINGGYDNLTTCGLTENVKTATYTTSSINNFASLSSAIVNDDEYTGSSGVYCKIVGSDEPGFQWANHIFNHAYTSGGTDCSTVTATTNATSATTDSGSGAGCNTYWIGNSSSQSANFYCAACGCDGGPVQISGVINSYAAGPNNVFCSTLDASSLNAYLTGSGSAWIGTASGGTLCVPGSNTPGAPSPS